MPAPRATLALLIGLSGCIWLTDKDLQARLDLDDDGLSNAEDCAPEDAEIGPATDWFLDGDGDGYGLPGSAWTACEADPGWVGAAGDCDDAEAGVNPGEAESCGDGLDNDCDGSADLIDVDGDGYNLCGEDCDDADASVHPEAEDLCDDGIDADCDDADERCDRDLADGALVLYGAASDELGTVLTVADLSGDGRDDVLVGGGEVDGAAGDDVGAVYLVASPGGEPGESVAIAARADLVLEGLAGGDGLGASLFADMDLDQDGALDLLVGATGVDLSASHQNDGAVYVLSGPLSAGRSLSEADQRYLGGGRSYGWVGSSVLVLDLGEGGLSMVIGAATERLDVEPTDIGVVYFAPDTWWRGDEVSSEVSLDAWDEYLYGLTASDRLGERLADAGDLDGDGLSELALCCRDCESDDATAGEGAVYLLYSGDMPIGAPWAVEDVAAAIWGGEGDARTGRSCASAGDVDGDDLGDLWVGATGLLAGAGEVILVLGGGGAASTYLDDASRLAIQGTYASEDVQPGLGASVTVGDPPEGGGPRPLALGSPGLSAGGAATADYAGAVYLLETPTESLGGAASIDELDAVVLMGQPGDISGKATAFGEALGQADALGLLVGAEGNATGGAAAGGVYVLLNLDWP